ncbi:MAG TPA: nitroreductase family protein [Acidimicrobiales bacterium]|nr:nitroreductase family protein [Acidimicrobiales bacterium]
MDLIDTLRSTGAVREFRPDPVPDEVLARVLDSARFAPSGGNRQGWRLVVVQDPAIRRRLRDCYLDGWYDYLAIMLAGLTPWAPVTDRSAEASALAGASRLAEQARDAGGRGGFAEQLDAAPVLLALFADLRALSAVDRDHARYTFAGGASIYPFAWNVLLAARAEGLGGVVTTMPIRREEDVKALLGAPAELALAAVLALGYPREAPPTRLRRAPVASFTTVDRVDGPAFGT